MPENRVRAILGLFLICAAAPLFAQSNRIDLIRHDAPELADFGDYTVGVRTLTFIDPDRADILNTQAGEETRVYDRSLIVELWYPASPRDDATRGTQYTTNTRNLSITATLWGRAVRDASPLAQDAPFPLIIISHGYPGNRYLMSHLGENLASKGYVVASIDHTDSTYHDQQAFASTLYNRPLDQLFVLQRISELAFTPQNFLGGLVDANRTGIIGYSMGGYGLVINLGGGVSDEFVEHELAPVNRLAQRHAATDPEFLQRLDSRIKAAIAVAPWGMTRDVWRPADLNAITVPTLYISGSQDDVSGYEDGTRALFRHATGSERYLLTYLSAGHSAAAPIPMPIEFLNSDDQTGASHYTDPVWDTARMNNIMNHFTTAFLDLHTSRRSTSRREYLDVVENAADGVFAVEDGKETPAHTYWKGFAARTARGLILERLSARRIDRKADIHAGCRLITSKSSGWADMKRIRLPLALQENQ